MAPAQTTPSRASALKRSTSTSQSTACLEAPPDRFATPRKQPCACCSARLCMHDPVPASLNPVGVTTCHAWSTEASFRKAGQQMQEERAECTLAAGDTRSAQVIASIAAVILSPTSLLACPRHCKQLGWTRRSSRCPAHSLVAPCALCRPPAVRGLPQRRTASVQHHRDGGGSGAQAAAPAAGRHGARGFGAGLWRLPPGRRVSREKPGLALHVSTG